MSGTTLLLILKSLFPLAREVILRDKDLRAFLLDNKLASVLFGCLIFLFVLFMYISGVADSALKEIDRLKLTSQHQVSTIDDLRERNTALQRDKESLLETLKNRAPPQSPTAHQHNADSTKSPPRRPPKPKSDDMSIKFYIEQRIRNLKNDGK